MRPRKAAPKRKSTALVGVAILVGAAGVFLAIASYPARRAVDPAARATSDDESRTHRWFPWFGDPPRPSSTRESRLVIAPWNATPGNTPPAPKGQIPAWVVKPPPPREVPVVVPTPPLDPLANPPPRTGPAARGQGWDEMRLP